MWKNSWKDFAKWIFCDKGNSKNKRSYRQYILPAGALFYVSAMRMIVAVVIGSGLCYNFGIQDQKRSLNRE